MAQRARARAIALPSFGSNFLSFFFYLRKSISYILCKYIYVVDSGLLPATMKMKARGRTKHQRKIICQYHSFSPFFPSEMEWKHFFFLFFAGVCCALTKSRRENIAELKMHVVDFNWIDRDERWNHRLHNGTNNNNNFWGKQSSHEKCSFSSFTSDCDALWMRKLLCY